MSCPDWSRLLAWRLAGGLDEPDGWRGALAHLATCERCRRRALETDPTLVFQALRPPPATAGETEEIKRSVHALRRAGRFDGLGGLRPRRRLEIAAAALLAAVLLLPVHTGRGLRRPGGEGGTAGARSAVPAPVALSRSLPHERLPLIEVLDRPRARVYQLRDDEVSLVMVVDESLDV